MNLSPFTTTKPGIQIKHQIIGFSLSAPPETKIFSYSTELSFEARDKLSKRKLVPRTQSYLLAHWILAERARARVEPCDLF